MRFGAGGKLTAFLALENVHETVAVRHAHGLAGAETHGAFASRAMRSGRKMF